MLLDPPRQTPDEDGDMGLDPRDALIEIRPNMGLLPCNVDMAAAEHELAEMPDRQMRLKAIIAPLLDDYEFVIIDCPPSLGLLTLNGLAAAREVIMPMQAHFLALQGVGKLLETVTLVGQRVNPQLRVTGAILCMHDQNSRHSKEVVADIEGFFEAAKEQDVPWAGARVYRPAVRRNIKLAECPSFGETVFEYAPGCPGAKDYGKLAGSLIREWDRMLERKGHAIPVKAPVAVDVPSADEVPAEAPEIVVAESVTPEDVAARAAS